METRALCHNRERLAKCYANVYLIGVEFMLQAFEALAKRIAERTGRAPAQRQFSQPHRIPTYA